MLTELTTVQVTFVSPLGEERVVAASVGRSVMQAAVDHEVGGMRAECGGQCSCATCHCYVPEPWLSRLPPKMAGESDLIDFVWEPRPNSRLSCQLQVTADLEGLVIELPAQQI